MGSEEWKKNSLIHENEVALRHEYKLEFPDRTALKTLWDWYDPRIFRSTASAILRETNSSEIDDCLQTSFMKLDDPRSRNGYDECRVWAWWANRVVRNEALDIKRKKLVPDGPRGKTVFAGGQPPASVNFEDISSDEPEPDGTALQLEFENAVHTCISMLDEIDRRIIVDVFFGDRTQTEMTNDLGIGGGAITKRKQKALMKLRHCLEGKGFGEISR